MPHYDLPLAELRSYRAATPAPVDLMSFWDVTLEEARQEAQPLGCEAQDVGLTHVDVFDVTFTGSGGQPVRAWYRRPATADGDLPVVVVFHGYGGGRGLPHQGLLWPAVGYAVLDVDTRGQGTADGWVGSTPDHELSAAPSAPGFMTRGILDRFTYFYRRVFTDAALAVEAVPQLPGADAGQIIVTGTSQGGGIALAAAALAPTSVAAVMPNIPFLCDFERATRLAQAGPYLEIASYLATHRDRVGEVFTTLSYFDAVHMASMATSPSLWSVAHMDSICPPSTVYAAYNAYAGPKEIAEYPFNDHEGGQFHHESAQIGWLAERLKPATRSTP